MIGRRFIDALRTPVLPALPFQVPGVPWPQRGLRRPCGCVSDPVVFGHTGCPDAPPDLREVR